MKSIFTKALIIIALIVGMISCSSDDNRPKEPECHISQISNAGKTTILTYNSTGKLIQASNPDFNHTYFYDGNTIIINIVGNPSNEYNTFRRTLTLGSNGLPAIVYDDQFYNKPDKWQNLAFEYSGNQIQKMTPTTNQEGVILNTEQYQWQNGNIISISSGDSVTTLEYYDLPLQQGDFFIMENTLYFGISHIKNTNLLKKINSTNNWQIFFDYDFDTSGKINSVSFINNGTPYLYTYTYECE